MTTLVFQQKPFKVPLSVICNSGIFKTSLCLCLVLEQTWQFLAEVQRILLTHPALGRSLEMIAIILGVHHVSTITGLSLPMAGCTFGDELSQKIHQCYRREEGGRLTCSAQVPVGLPCGYEPANFVLATLQFSQESTCKSTCLEKLGAVSLVEVYNMEIANHFNSL